MSGYSMQEEALISYHNSALTQELVLSLGQSPFSAGESVYDVKLQSYDTNFHTQFQWAYLQNTVSESIDATDPNQWASMRLKGDFYTPDGNTFKIFVYITDTEQTIGSPVTSGSMRIIMGDTPSFLPYDGTGAATPNVYDSSTRAWSAGLVATPFFGYYPAFGGEDLALAQTAAEELSPINVAISFNIQGTEFYVPDGLPAGSVYWGTLGRELFLNLDSDASDEYGAAISSNVSIFSNYEGRDAALFESSQSSYLQVPFSSNYNLNNEFTISTWLAAPSVPAGQTMTVLQIGSGNNNVINISINPSDSASNAGHIKFSAKDSLGTSGEVYSVNPIVDNQWTHIALTKTSSGSITLYVNGQMSGDLYLSNPIVFAAGDFVEIGRTGESPQDYLDASLDNFELHRYGMMHSNVAWKYQEGIAIYGGGPSISLLDSGPFSYQDTIEVVTDTAGGYLEFINWFEKQGDGTSWMHIPDLYDETSIIVDFNLSGKIIAPAMSVDGSMYFGDEIQIPDLSSFIVPVVKAGHFPAFETEDEAVLMPSGDGTALEYNLIAGKPFYMPGGLTLGVDMFEGNYLLDSNYKFETNEDETGNYDLDLSGITGGLSSIAGRDALNFHTSAQSLTLSDPNIFDYGTSSFTVSFWAKVSVGDGVNSSLLSKRYDSNAIGYSIYKDSADKIVAEVSSDGTNFYTIKSEQPVADTNFVHISMIVDRDDSLMELYIDGQLQNAGVDISSLGSISNAEPLSLGLENGMTHLQYFAIDDLYFFGRKMEDLEVLDWYDIDHVQDPSQGVTLIIESQDTYGDGWNNGATVEIFDAQWNLLHTSSGPGNSDNQNWVTETLFVPNDATYNWRATGGSFTYENMYKILHPDSSILLVLNMADNNGNTLQWPDSPVIEGSFTVGSVAVPAIISASLVSYSSNNLEVELQMNASAAAVADNWAYSTTTPFVVGSQHTGTVAASLSQSEDIAVNIGINTVYAAIIDANGDVIAIADPLVVNTESVVLTMSQYDAAGDGWNGAMLTVYDSNGAETAIKDITLSSGTTGSENFSLVPGSYTYSLTPGYYPEEVGLQLETAGGYELIVVAPGELTQSGLTGSFTFVSEANLAIVTADLSHAGAGVINVTSSANNNAITQGAVKWSARILDENMTPLNVGETLPGSMALVDLGAPMTLSAQVGGLTVVRVAVVDSSNVIVAVRSVSIDLLVATLISTGGPHVWAGDYLNLAFTPGALGETLSGITLDKFFLNEDGSFSHTEPLPIQGLYHELGLEDEGHWLRATATLSTGQAIYSNVFVGGILKDLSAKYVLMNSVLDRHENLYDGYGLTNGSFVYDAEVNRNVLDITGGYFDIPEALSSSISSYSQYSIGFWVKPSAFSQNKNILLSNADNNGDYSIEVSFDSTGNLVLAHNDGYGTELSVTWNNASGVPVGTWSYIHIDWWPHQSEGGKVSFYINGQPAGDPHIVNLDVMPQTPFNNRLRVGSDVDGFEGRLSDLRVYKDQAISGAQRYRVLSLGMSQIVSEYVVDVTPGQQYMLFADGRLVSPDDYTVDYGKIVFSDTRSLNLGGAITLLKVQDAVGSPNYNIGG
jgi:hypothetical protein